MRQKDVDFEDGRSYGIWEIISKLRDYANKTNDNETINIINNAIEIVSKGLV
jgi:hypothetical protein